MNKEQIETLIEILEVGRDAAHEVAQRFHEEMKGYREAEHKQVDKDVADLNEAIAMLEVERALLAAAPAPIQQEQGATHKRQVFMAEIDAAAAGSEWLQPFFTSSFSICFSVDEGARAPRAKWCMLFDSLDRVVAGYMLTRDAKNWTELTLIGGTSPASCQDGEGEKA